MSGRRRACILTVGRVEDRIAAGRVLSARYDPRHIEGGMANSRAAIELVSVRHAGDPIGDDWSYEITIHGDRKVVPMAPGRGRPGTSDLDVPPLRWDFRLPGCARHDLDLRIVSTEHDIAFDDVGKAPPDSRIVVDPTAPASKEVAITRVTELLNGVHEVHFLFRVTTECI